MNRNEKKIWEELKDRYNTCKMLSRVLDGWFREIMGAQSLR